MLISKSERREESGVLREGRKEDPLPALAIRASMCVMECWVVRVWISALAQLSSEVMARGAMMSLLVGEVCSASRSAMGVLVERIVAMIVVLGLRRRVRVRPKPIPEIWRGMST